MKFGVVIHKPTMNLGDDIQTYAAAKLLPHVDYQIDREYISDFKSENDEPVAVIMNAWWMWKKWNWPPADCIIPKLLSMHINNYGVARKSSPIYAEWAQGCGGEFFKKYGPVGCRDMASLDFFKEQGIDCYFSGCLTSGVDLHNIGVSISRNPSFAIKSRIRYATLLRSIRFFWISGLRRSK